jgi:hypothetical protein
VENSKKVQDDGEPEHGVYISTTDKSLYMEGEKLCRLIDEHQILKSNTGPQRPLIILAFDEADILINNPPSSQGWNMFTKLRRILRQI